jgi:hypothetical protein
VACLECGDACVDVLHRLAPVTDDLLPEFLELPPSALNIAARATVVVGGLVLAGGAAYGIVPGELGHNGARVVDVREPAVKSAAEVLADAYRPAKGLASAAAAGTSSPGTSSAGTSVAARLDGASDEVVYVDGTVVSDGPSIVSAAFPAPDVSVLATRGADGSCTWLRGTPESTKVATVPATAAPRCSAVAAPRTGWTFAKAYGSKRN